MVEAESENILLVWKTCSKNKPSTNRAQLFCIIIIINKSMEIFCKREQ